MIRSPDPYRNETVLRIPLFALIPVVLIACGAPARSNVVPAVPTLAGGIQINEADLDEYTAAVRSAGLDSVQVTFYARQAAWNTAGLTFVPEEGEAVIGEIRAAHAAGLKVVLVLRTYLEHGLPANRHLWHGMIHPPDDQLDLWFERYGAFVRFGAELAEREGVEVLVVGNELNSMTTTRPLDEVPQVWDYWLQPERTATVRQELVSCADQVPEAPLRDSLRWLDGHEYPDLAAALSAEDDVRRAWAVEVTRAVHGTPDLDAMNRRAAHLDASWRSLIAQVRTWYSGTVAYGANFDHFDHVGFWDAVDALGVTSYFPLSLWGAVGSDQEEQLRASWRGIADDLGAAAARARPGAPLPVYLLELGWTRKAGSTVRPWSYDRVEVLETVGPRKLGAAPDLTCVHWATWPEEPTERDRAMRALVDVVREGDFPELRGFSLWKLTTKPYHQDVEPFAIVLPGVAQPLEGQDADRVLLQAATELSGWIDRAAE
jgi:hypothetical protein